jgi:hypothetical protein
VSARAAAAIVVGLLVAACGAGRPRGPMSDGERMYLAKCTSCHDAYAPGQYRPAEWAKMVGGMEAEKKVTLSGEERALILGYLSGQKVAAASH